MSIFNFKKKNNSNINNTTVNQTPTEKEVITVKDAIAYLRDVRTHESGIVSAKTVYARIVDANGTPIEHYIRDNYHKHILEGFEYNGNGKDWLMSRKVTKIKLVFRDPFADNNPALEETGYVDGAKFYDIIIDEICDIKAFSSAGLIHFNNNKEEYEDCMRAVRDIIFTDIDYVPDMFNEDEFDHIIEDLFYGKNEDDNELYEKLDRIHTLYFVSTNQNPDGTPAQVVPLPEWFWKGSLLMPLPMEDIYNDDSNILDYNDRYRAVFDSKEPKYSNNAIFNEKKNISEYKEYWLAPHSDPEHPGYYGKNVDGTPLYNQRVANISRFNEAYFELLDKAYEEFENDPQRKFPIENYEVMTKFDIKREYKNGNLMIPQGINLATGGILDFTPNYKRVGGTQESQ